MPNFTSVITAVITATLASAMLADDCDNDELNTFDAVYCVNKVFIAEDGRLNDAYSELRTHLGSDDRSTLLNAQRNWIDFRNDECTGTSEKWGNVVYTGCALDTTRARAEFLEARINECKTVGCATSKLSNY